VSVGARTSDGTGKPFTIAQLVGRLRGGAADDQPLQLKDTPSVIQRLPASLVF
jgi:hypothetical protein